MHGRGRLIQTDGEVYEGEWSEGLKHGHGRLTDTRGVFYSGEFSEGKKHGHHLGKMLIQRFPDLRILNPTKWHDGSTYEG
jgi:hypothetical protein